MTTINATGNGLSGTTGTGNFVGSTSPTLVTPTLGAATATSITFSPTTSGIVGTTTNDNAAAGKVGEFISSRIANGSAVSVTNNMDKDITTISLTAGDWDVWGNVWANSSVSMNYMACWTNSVSVTNPDNSLSSLTYGAASATLLGVPAPYQRYSLSETTTIYITVLISGSGTLTASGGIYARRAR